MDKATLLAVIADAGGPENIHGLTFDNSMVIFFTSKERLSLDDIVTIGGMDFYVNHTKVLNKVTGSYDIDRVNYHPLECLQAIETIKDSSKMAYIAADEMYMYGTNT